MNGASFAPGPVAPGSIVSIFGSALASGTAQATTASLPTTLQSTQVLINGITAPLFYVSPTQINAQVPWEVTGLFSTDLTVKVVSNDASSNVVAAALVITAPGIFVITHNADNTVVTSARPAVPGEYLRVYCTGLGMVTNEPPTGAPGPFSPLAYTAQNSTVTIAGLSAYVPYSGLAPGFVGLYQVNVQVPANAVSASAAPLVLSNGGNSTTADIVVQSGGAQQFTLTAATAGSGSGSISANPPGPSYAAGTVVTLIATPNAGSTFAGWSGACSGTGSCTVTMNSAQAVTATFNLAVTVNPTLTITTSGTGSGTVSPSPAGTSCGSGCLSFAAGTVVALTAAPNTGSTFAGWSGACSGTGRCTVTMNSNQTVTATFNLTSSTGNGITIRSLSSASPIPLTVLQIGTSGVNAANPVTLQFSNGAGFSATEQAVRVQSDGTVIAGVPLYVDPATGRIGPGTVSLVVTQGTQSSAPTSVAIQDLPLLSAYGTQLGQISDAFLVFEALLHAQRLNEFQAAQQLVGTSVNTLSAQTTMGDLLDASILARADIDNVMSSNGAVISWGSLADGTHLQFDSTQLDVMDRIIAVYLTQQFPSSISSIGTSPSAQSLLKSPPWTHEASSHPELNFSSMTSLVTCLASVSNACFMQAQEAVQSSPNATDTSTAWLTGSGATLKLAGAEQAAGVAGLALGYAHFAAAMDSLTHGISDTAECLASLGCNSDDQGAIQQELTGAGAEIVGSITETISQVPVILGLELEQQTVEIISQGTESIVKIAKDGSSGQIAGADRTDVSLVSPSTLSQLSGHLGYVAGSVENTSSQGATAPQSGLDLCCFGASQLGITGLADSGGSYDLLVPLGVAGTNYAALTMSATDPLTGNTQNSETADLSGLNTTTPITAPTLNTGATSPPTTPPPPGTYAGACSAQSAPIQCCDPVGGCTTVPGTSTQGPFGFTLVPGTSLSQFSSQVCANLDAALSAAGCASFSCNFTAATSTSATFVVSCAPPVAPCTGGTVTETCSATQ